MFCRVINAVRSTSVTSRAWTAMSGHQQAHSAHTDMRVPDMAKNVRWSELSGPTAEDTSYGRLVFSYSVMGMGGMSLVVGGKQVVTSLLDMKNPSAAAWATSKTEVDIGKITEGTNYTVMWQGKPCFIRHRTPEEIKQMKEVNLKELRDPQHDDDRVVKPEWLVVSAICTHLGCVPVAYKGDFRGYFCPCHGSHYDASGRIRKGPAPLNLEVPKYKFPDEDTLIIG